MIRRILVMMDFSPAALRALRVVRRGFPDARLDVLHVLSGGLRPAVPPVTPAARGQSLAALSAREGEWMREAALRLHDLGGGELAEGDPAEVALGRAREGRCDLIALGVTSRGTLDRLVFGSVAERLIRTAPVPVLTVHDGGPFADPEAP